MNVSVFGLGYVGSVSAAAFASDGHHVVGVDVQPAKVDSINAGRSPIVEPGLDSLMQEAHAAGRLRATLDTREAVHASDVSLLCVGTPSRKNGSLDLSYLERVCEQIGDALATKSTYHVVVVRSTVLPGTTHEVVIPALERRSGKKYGDGFGVSVNPEFLREGTAIHDFRHPPLTLVGHNHAADAAGTTALYGSVEAPLVTTSIRVAEMMKYTSNTWHALKVCFANEIGNLCKRVGVDSHEVMVDLLPGRQAESVVLLPPAGIRVRRLVPAEGRARAPVPGEGGRPRSAGHRLDPRQQPPADRPRARDDHRQRAEARRPARLQLQGGHRRPAREPDRRPRRGAARQGATTCGSTTGTSRSPGWSAQTRITSSTRSRTSPRSCRTRWTTCSTTPR